MLAILHRALLQDIADEPNAEGIVCYPLPLGARFLSVHDLLEGQRLHIIGETLVHEIHHLWQHVSKHMSGCVAMQTAGRKTEEHV